MCWSQSEGGGVELQADYKFNLKVDDKRRIVEVIYRGMINLDDRQRAVDAATRIMEERGYHGVLVDFSDAEMEMLNPEKESGFADVLSKNPILARGCTAYLSRPGQSINWFIEVLARARRFRCKHFTNRNEAYSWLAQNA